MSKVGHTGRVMVTRHRGISAEDLKQTGVSDGDHVPVLGHVRRPYPSARIFAIELVNQWFYITWVSHDLYPGTVPPGFDDE